MRIPSQGRGLQGPSDYAERYEEIFLSKEGPNRENQLSEITDEYHDRMSNLAQDGKWTPLQEMGDSIKLSFLIGQFQAPCGVVRLRKYTMITV